MKLLNLIHPAIALFSVTVAIAVGAATVTDMDRKPASAATIQAQKQFQSSLPLDNGEDEKFVNQGFIATLDNPVVLGSDGHVVTDPSQLDWVKGKAPSTVNPSLWRHMKLQRVHGLFEVVKNVWQVRAIDGSNMTIIQGNIGWVIIDPLLTTEAAKAAMLLIDKHLGERSISAVIYTHSHPDHFGGVRALVASNETLPIIAPEHFLAETVSEYLVAGNIMTRRGTYQLGMGLKRDPQGFVGSGLSTTFSQGTVSLIAPTDTITATGETRVIDGVTLEFQMVPETEAPSEMNVYLPEHNTFVIAEMVSCTMHNIQTPRGAKARDALGWAGYLTEALSLYGNKAEVLVSGHCWPRFGNDAVKEHLQAQRDNYKFIHDQTVRLMNQGQTPTEIAEYLKLPAGIAKNWSTHGYYGTFKHNLKGVFQHYIGWWDGIPAHLDMYPQVEQGRRYVKAMGGSKNLIKQARNAMNDGDYRWSAEILNHLVFSESDNTTAKALLADSYEQMGYQAESAVWRNIFLTGADELRGGDIYVSSFVGKDLVDAMTTESFFTLLATRLNPEKIGDVSMTIAVNVADKDESALVSVRNAVMVSEMGVSITNPDITITGKRDLLMGLLLQGMPLEKMTQAGLIISGDTDLLRTLQSAIDSPTVDYSIITP